MMDIRVDSVVIPPCLPSFISLNLKRIGEAADRSLCPCVLQVDADAMVWLCSPHGPCEVPYIYIHIWMWQAYISSHIINIPPGKPCRRRRHFSPQMRINRFVFLNLPILSLGEHLGLTASPHSPLPAGYVTLPVTAGHRRLGSCSSTAKSKAVACPPFSVHSKNMHLG